MSIWQGCVGRKKADEKSCVEREGVRALGVLNNKQNKYSALLERVKLKGNQLQAKENKIISTHLLMNFSHSNADVVEV